MKKNNDAKQTSLAAKILAGALAAFLIFGSIAGVLIFLL